MTNQITENQRDKMRYRRMVVKEKLRDIEQLVTGRGESYLPFVTDENGIVNAAKTRLFVGEMLGALNHYAEFGKHRRFDKDTLSMYESFLYCAVMSMHFDRSTRSSKVREWKIPSVFEDIVSIAKKVDISGCGSYDSYIKECYRDYRDAIEEDKKSPLRRLVPNMTFQPCPSSAADSDFLTAVKRSLGSAGCKHFVKSLPEETLLELRRDYEEKYPPDESTEDEDTALPFFNGDAPDAVAEYYAKRDRENEIREELENLEPYKTYSDIGGSKEEVEKIAAREAWDRVDELIMPKWKRTVDIDKNREMFEKHFSNFVRLYFDSSDRGYFAEDIENMVDTFLFEHRISAFSLGDDYAMVDYSIDQMAKRIAKEIKKGERQ